MAKLLRLKIFACSVCARKNFDTKRGLSVHFQKMHKNKMMKEQYACSECKKRKFGSIVALNTHLSKAHPEIHRKFIKDSPYGITKSSRKIGKRKNKPFM